VQTFSAPTDLETLDSQPVFKTLSSPPFLKDLRYAATPDTRNSSCLNPENDLLAASKKAKMKTFVKEDEQKKPQRSSRYTHTHRYPAQLHENTKLAQRNERL
jgi:hypothetical protein